MHRHKTHSNVLHPVLSYRMLPHWIEITSEARMFSHSQGPLECIAEICCQEQWPQTSTHARLNQGAKLLSLLQQCHALGSKRKAAGLKDLLEDFHRPLTCWVKIYFLWKDVSCKDVPWINPETGKWHRF